MKPDASIHVRRHAKIRMDLSAERPGERDRLGRSPRRPAEDMIGNKWRRTVRRATGARKIAIPESFLQGLQDIVAGRVVELNTALYQPYRH